LNLTSCTVSDFTSVATCSLTTGLGLSFFEKLMLLNDQDFFFFRFFSADACTSVVADSSAGLLIDSSAVTSKSPLASEAGTSTSVFSSEFAGSLMSLAGSIDSPVSYK
jgi:hypothetical protein